MATRKVAQRNHTRRGTTQLRRKASELNKDFHDLGGIATRVARAKVGEVRNQAADYFADGVDKLEEVQDSIAVQIRANPFRSMIIAAGVGLVVGRVLLR